MTNKPDAGGSEEARSELLTAINAYNLTAEGDMRVRPGKDLRYRQIVPSEWKTSHLHYEFYQARGRIGAELHIHSDEVVRLADFLKAFAGRAVANGEGTLEWDQNWNSGRGRLAAFFPLTSSPGTVAASMRDLILLTRSGVSEYLASHIPAALAVLARF